MLNTGSLLTERVSTAEAGDSVLSNSVPRPVENLEESEEALALGLWLRSLLSFFHLRNHPFSETEQAQRLARDWSNELRIARRALLQSSQLALRLLSVRPSSESETVLEAAGNLKLQENLTAPDTASETDVAGGSESLVSLTEMLSEACAVCEAMLAARPVGYTAWSNLSKMLAREFEQNAAAQRVMRAALHHAAAGLQAPLVTLVRAKVKPPALGADMLLIFTSLARMLETLRFVERILRRDQPLKSLLPVFTLVHEESRLLLEFIDTRVMRTDGLDGAIFDALDGTNYAVSMELKKVFAHELVGLSALRQAPDIYARVENAHGLLRDCFQQSTVSLAQLFDPHLEGAQLFDAFQTKLEQSLALRADLWRLLQLVRRAERERDQRPVAPLLERLAAFREGSLRYLMYKDWEACERFMEEVAAARGAIELAPVLHRFGAYLETLHGQVNMRAVLADHPFEYLEPED